MTESNSLYRLADAMERIADALEKRNILGNGTQEETCEDLRRKGVCVHSDSDAD